MHGTIIKKIGFTFLLLTFLTALPAETPWYSILSPRRLQYCVAGAIAALIIGKISYNYYRYNPLSHDTFIEECQSIYEEIYQDTHNYHCFYQRDAQISDWDLKEIILHNNQETFPFMTYYLSLTQAFFTLQKHLLTLQNQLLEIDQHKKQLHYKKRSKKTDHWQKMLLELENKEKELQAFTIETTRLTVILKNKIKLFKEYSEDCHNSSQALLRSMGCKGQANLICFLHKNFSHHISIQRIM